MNLIAYPAWTCGGLFCDILNKTLSPIDNNGGIGLPALKGLLIVHGNNTQDNIAFREKIKSVDLSQDIWVGTHTYPELTDLQYFNKVIIVNLTTPKSITYRYARILHQCIHGNGINGNRKLSSPKLWDTPVFDRLLANNVDNIEFEDVVEWNGALVQLFNKHLSKQDQPFIDNRKNVWQNLNKFLYDSLYVGTCKERLSFSF